MLLQSVAFALRGIHVDGSCPLDGSEVCCGTRFAAALVYSEKVVWAKVRFIVDDHGQARLRDMVFELEYKVQAAQDFLGSSLPREKGDDPEKKSEHDSSAPRSPGGPVGRMGGDPKRRGGRGAGGGDNPRTKQQPASQPRQRKGATPLAVPRHFVNDVPVPLLERRQDRTTYWVATLQAMPDQIAE